MHDIDELLDSHFEKPIAHTPKIHLKHLFAAAATGLVYKHFGREVIAKLIGAELAAEAAVLELVYQRVYDNFIQVRAARCSAISSATQQEARIVAIILVPPDAHDATFSLMNNFNFAPSCFPLIFHFPICSPDIFRCPFSPQALDGGDNGVSQYPADIAPKYKVGTALPQRVAQLNPGAAISLYLSISLYVSLCISSLHLCLFRHVFAYFSIYL